MTSFVLILFAVPRECFSNSCLSPRYPLCQKIGFLNKFDLVGVNFSSTVCKKYSEMNAMDTPFKDVDKSSSFEHVVWCCLDRV
ncbi:hypothetical protein DER46DRAFT_607655 [Fusarium sp. MPI-SDFR-AT-0072]|nr:hypothetical protein DER46DRAFT_607655 [Fusarium sp. MPI-SDFR-AT-0072]